jgi:hypothetical protein
MQKSYRFLASALILGAFLLSACSGVLPQQDDSSQGPAGAQFTEVVFTGTVDAMGGTQWTISGQLVGVEGSTVVDPGIQVGDIVKVEARVSSDGKVLAFRIEASKPDDGNANEDNSNGNMNANDDNSNDNTNANGNANDNANGNANVNGNANDNGAPAGAEREAFGVVQAITANSIIINGVTYKLAKFTEFKHPIAVGDQVKIHVIVNADGTLTIREIEKTRGTGIGNNNSNSNSNSNGNSNDNSNDDKGNSNSNDNDDDDDNSNSNSNDND